MLVSHKPCSPVLRRLVGWIYSSNARLNGCPWGDGTCIDAAYGGDIEILQWARQQDPSCPWGESTFASAAACGQVETLEWLYRKNCPWDEWTCAGLAEPCWWVDPLKWVREKGCPWNVQTCIRARTEGHMEVLEWAKRNGCPDLQP